MFTWSALGISSTMPRLGINFVVTVREISPPDRVTLWLPRDFVVQHEVEAKGDTHHLSSGCRSFYRQRVCLSHSFKAILVSVENYVCT